MLGFVVAVLLNQGFVHANEVAHWSDSIYIGAGVGQLKVDKSFCKMFEDTTSCDRKDTSFKFFVGYQFNKYFSTEVGYVGLGEISQKDSTGWTGEREVDGLMLHGVFSYPFTDKISVNAKVGIYSLNRQDTGSGGIFAKAKNDEDVSEISLGIGLAYDLKNGFALRAEWEKIAVEESSDDGFDLITASLLYSF
ncbi:MAG: outer membrane beta-barrel protein [Gammaproteobacteria bacterium]|nr:outer membrane beta-barrel protein [Gammaproteobacteria bacterium]